MTYAENLVNKLALVNKLTLQKILQVLIGISIRTPPIFKAPAFYSIIYSARTADITMRRSLNGIERGFMK
jgi:hypothetical protein